MIEFSTERLVAKTDMEVVDSKLITRILPCSDIDLLSLKRATGRETGFVFYDKSNEDIEICHISIVSKRGRFELSFGTIEEYRKMGYMSEALENTIIWIFKHTTEEFIWAIPGNSISEKILKKYGFEISAEEQENDFRWFMLTREAAKK